MKKLLLGSAAIAGLVLASAPAQAQMELTIGGHSKNYVGYLDQDSDNVTDFGMVRETELHFNGESTLDNGLTFGFQVEMEVDAGDEQFNGVSNVDLDGDGDDDIGAFSDGDTIEESYIYLSGGFGRINLGSEDGAAYLLQVAAPSADSNIDGLRQTIQPVNYTALLADDVSAAVTAVGFDANTFALTSTGGALNAPGGKNTADGFDYDQDLTGVAEKITYLSPNFGGLQFGASYTHDVGDTSSRNVNANGFSAQNDGGFDQAYEAGARYEGVFSNFGYAVGAGYTFAEDAGAGDDYDAWNAGLDVDAGPFGIGAAYLNEEYGGDVETMVVGADYTTGPFKFGASYLNQDDENGIAGAGTVAAVATAFQADIETDRYTGGVVYTAGPGLSFRGSVSYIEHDISGVGDVDATSAMAGVQINF